MNFFWGSIMVSTYPWFGFLGFQLLRVSWSLRRLNEELLKEASVGFRLSIVLRWMIKSQCPPLYCLGHEPSVCSVYPWHGVYATHPAVLVSRFAAEVPQCLSLRNSCLLWDNGHKVLDYWCCQFCQSPAPSWFPVMAMKLLLYQVYKLVLGLRV